MPFILPDLPYASDSLEPFMSANTFDYHHGKHHRAYVAKTNELLDGKQLAGASLIEVVRAARERDDPKLFINAAQLWNHSFFWQCLAPPQSTQPSGRLGQLIAEQFGSPETLVDQLVAEAVGHFSNGWAWLVINRGKLEITSLHDADTPLVYDGMAPLLTLDLWEHAYYIDYRNERPRFAKEVLSNIVNWDFVARNLDGDGAARADQQPAGERVPEGQE